MRAPFAASGLVAPSGRSISRLEVARVRASAMTAEPVSAGYPLAYEGASGSGTYFSEWPAALRSPDKDWLPNRAPVTARIRERVRNDPVAASARARKVNSAVGRGWRVKFRPNARALGIDIETARQLGADLSTEFQLYAYGHAFASDAERRLTWGQQLRLVVSQIVVDGESLGLAEWAADEETRYKTRLRLVDPDRLCNPSSRPDRHDLKGGVEFDAWGAALAYHIRQRHPSDYGGPGQFAWTRFERWTEWGRPQVFHAFEPERAGQTRGVSRFASSLKSFRALSRFTDATLQSATVNALIVAFMKSNAGPGAVSENFEPKDVREFETWRQDHYKEHPVNLANGAQIPVLPYGDELTLQTASKDVSSFDSFMRSILRLIAASLDVTYEELSMDYSQTNYSSARAALIHAWSATVALMGLVEDQLVRPFIVAWAEEAFDRGYVQIPDGAPDFYDAVDAYCQIHCIGPGRGFIDPTKEIDAAAARVEADVSTLEDECDDQGKDWEEVLEQKARERAKYQELGLPLPEGALAQAARTSRDPAHQNALDQRSAA
ncbi:MAG: phage portal protein [Brevundimonas sp.]